MSINLNKTLRLIADLYSESSGYSVSILDDEGYIEELELAQLSPTATPSERKMLIFGPMQCPIDELLRREDVRLTARLGRKEVLHSGSFKVVLRYDGGRSRIGQGSVRQLLEAKNPLALSTFVRHNKKVNNHETLTEKETEDPWDALLRRHPVPSEGAVMIGNQTLREFLEGNKT